MTSVFLTGFMIRILKCGELMQPLCVIMTSLPVTYTGSTCTESTVL